MLRKILFIFLRPYLSIGNYVLRLRTRQLGAWSRPRRKSPESGSDKKYFPCFDIILHPKPVIDGLAISEQKKAEVAPFVGQPLPVTFSLCGTSARLSGFAQDRPPIWRRGCRSTPPFRGYLRAPGPRTPRPHRPARPCFYCPHKRRRR